MENMRCAFEGKLQSLLDRRAVSPAVRSFIARKHELLIDGAWRAASAGGALPSMEPSTGEVLTTIAAADAHDVDLAVAAAGRALADGRWSRTPPNRREQVMMRLADLLERNAADLAVLETLDNGRAIGPDPAGEMAGIVAFLRYMAGWCTKIDGRAFSLSTPGAMGLTLKEPVGVVAAITPWNFPLSMAVNKVAPALAAGCSVVLKPAEQTSLTALRLGELALEAGIPDGVLNILTGEGPVVGEPLARHPGVAKLTFTGSTRVGQRLGALAMENMTRLTLELGGKSPMIVLADSDLDAAAQGVVDGLFFNAGQVCCAASRLLVERPIFDGLMAKVVERAEALRIGEGLDPATEMGPLVSQVQRARVQGYIDDALAAGVGLAAGGLWDGEGFFVRPHVFVDAPARSSILTEEVFGPVLCAAAFEDDRQALAAANDTRYGLAASVWSNDLKRVRRYVEDIRAGTVWVNAHNPADAALPFGGYGLSGFGREGGPENLDAYLETKAVWLG